MEVLGTVTVAIKEYEYTDLSYQVFKGDFDKRLHVLHTCDTPLCVNPGHLWLGTDADNARDSVFKKRRVKFLSEEHKRKIGDAVKGKPSWCKGKHLSPEHVAKTRFRRPHSEESKAKISAALKRKS